MVAVETSHSFPVRQGTQTRDAALRPPLPSRLTATSSPQLGLFCLASVQAQTVLYSAGLQAVLPRAARQGTVPVRRAVSAEGGVAVVLPFVIWQK